MLYIGRRFLHETITLIIQRAITMAIDGETIQREYRERIVLRADNFSTFQRSFSGTIRI